MLSFSPGSRVWISPTERGRKAATRSSGSSERATSTQHSTDSTGAANGMILTVPTIFRGSTTAKGGKVPRVIASSTRFSRSSRARSNTKSPRALAKRLARPVKGAAGSTSSPAAAAATRRAASSSPTSPGSSRATTIRERPAPAMTSRSARDSTRAFLSAVVPSLRLCARIAPSASATGTSPNLMPPLWLSRRGGGPASSRRRSRPPPRPATPRRSTDRPVRGCGRDHCRRNRAP